MSEIILSNYVCGDEAAQFTFFKMPRQLIDNPCFKSLSTAAKLLYGMLLDRMSLSSRNGWHDDAGRVYIYYTVKEVCQDIGCGRNKAMRLLAELDTVKGIGLIERIKQGQGKPDKIFVRKISVHEDTEISDMAEPNSVAPVSEVDFSDVQKSEIPTSRCRENRLLEVLKTDPNKTNQNQTEFIQINLSIPSHRKPGPEGIDRCEQAKANTGFVRRAICAPLLYWTSPGRTDLDENQPPGQSPEPAPGAVQFQQVCHLLNRRPLLGEYPHPPAINPTVRRKSNEQEYQHLKKAEIARLGINPFNAISLEAFRSAHDRRKLMQRLCGSYLLLGTILTSLHIGKCQKKCIHRGSPRIRYISPSGVAVVQRDAIRDGSPCKRKYASSPRQSRPAIASANAASRPV